VWKRTGHGTCHAHPDETIREVVQKPAPDRGAFVSEEVLIASLSTIDLLRAIVVGALVETLVRSLVFGW